MWFIECICIIEVGCGLPEQKVLENTKSFLMVLFTVIISPSLCLANYSTLNLVCCKSLIWY